jgi:ferric-dicitrate binding protein FerR (iron transport regulator)
MDQKSFVFLVKKYLSGNATSEEKNILENYDSKFVNETLPKRSVQEEADLEKELFDRIKRSIKTASEIKEPRRIYFNVYRIAASVTLLFCFGWFIYGNRYRIMEVISPIKNTTVTVERGKIKKLILEDGSLVILNAGSQLTFPDKFRGDSRTVTLSGEGYFNVTHHPDQPFIVNTTHLEVKVLGTRFNVSSYSESAATDVAVVSGRVSVQAKEEKNQNVILTPSQKVRYRISDRSLIREDTDSTDVMGWQHGELNFKNQAMGEVAKILERKYDIRIETDKVMENCRIYAKIGNDPAELTLNALATLLNAKLEIHNHSYKLTGAGCN